MNMSKAFGYALLVLVGGCADPDPESASVISVQNPVIDANFPDPAAIKATDGYYYVYATQGEVDGKMQNIQIARSRDLATWERVGDALPLKPDWASKTQDFWAPHVSYHGGKYYLIIQLSPTLRSQTR